MSNEWSRASFAPAGAAPIGFMPRGLLDDAPVLSPHELAAVARAGRSGFVAGPPLAARGSGFEASSRFAGGPAPAAAPPAAEPEATIVAAPDFVIDPAPVEPALPVDLDLLYAEGVAEGRRLAAAEGSDDRVACAQLLSALGGGSRFDRAALADRLRQTVLALVRQIVGETGVAPELLCGRIDGAVNMLADVTEPARVHLNPADLRLVSEHLAPNLAAIADPLIERGGFRLETMSAIVEDGPALWLDQLAEALDRVATPA